MAKCAKPVMGRDLPGPRLTRAGWGLVALWVGLPLALFIVVSDILGWALAKALWGVCFGLVCWL